MESECPRCGSRCDEDGSCTVCGPGAVVPAAAGWPEDLWPPSDIRTRLQQSELGAIEGADARDTADPTDDYAPPRHGRYPLTPTDVGRWAGSLRGRRMLVLSCADPNVLMAAPAAIVEDAQFAWATPRMVCLPCRRRPQLHFEDLVDNDHRWPRGTLIIVDATHVDARCFVEDLLDFMVLNHLHVTQHKLEALDRWIVVLTTPELVGEEDALRAQDRAHIPHEAIPFVEPRIRHLAPSRADEICARLAQQRSRGLWGEHERELYDRLRAFGSAASLEVELDRLDSVAPSVGAPARVDVEEIVAAGSALDHAALYAAAVFPNLPLEDFETAVLALLGARRLPAQPGRLDEAGHAAALHRLADLWLEERPGVFRRCQLVTVTGDDSVGETAAMVHHPLVCFAHPPLRDTVLRALERRDPWVHLENQRRIEDAGLLFTAERDLLQGVIRLAVEIAAASPEKHGSEWLIAALLRAVPTTGTETRARAEGLQERLARMPDAARARLFNRIYHLVWAMLKKPLLADAVAQFFSQLMAMQRYEDLLDLVRRLRNEGAVDEMRWIRRILDEGTAGARSSAYRELRGAVRSRGPRLAKVLDALLGWVQESGAADRPSQRFAQMFLLDICEDTMFGPRRGPSGAWPPRHPVLAALAEPSADELLRRFVTAVFGGGLRALVDERWAVHADALLGLWLVPEGLRKALPDGGRALAAHVERALRDVSAEIARQHVIAGCLAPDLFHALYLADLCVLLLGNHEEAPATEAAALFGAVLSSVQQATNSQRRRRIREYLRAMNRSLLEALGALRDGADPAGRAEREAKARTRRHLCGARLRISMLQDRIAAMGGDGQDRPRA